MLFPWLPAWPGLVLGVGKLCQLLGSSSWGWRVLVVVAVVVAVVEEVRTVGVVVA